MGHEKLHFVYNAGSIEWATGHHAIIHGGDKMAVTIKTKELTIVRLVERLFAPEDVKGGLLNKATALQDAGFKLKTNITDFRISNAQGSLFTVKIKLEAVQLAMAGKLGFVAKVAIKEQVSTLIEGAYDVMPDKAKWEAYRAEVMSEYGSHGTTNKVAAIKKLRELVKCSLKEAKDKVEEWIDNTVFKAVPVTEAKNTGEHIPPQFTVAHDHEHIENPIYQVNGKPVLLADANNLHQPVKGTSSSSTYNVIALGDTMNVAVRIQDDFNVSIRVHPKDNLVNLTSAGFKKSAQGHWSLHLNPDSREMAIKCVGAMLFTIGGPFHSVSGNVNALIGVGH